MRGEQSLGEPSTLSPGKVRTSLVSGQGKRGRSKTSLSCGASEQSREDGHRVLQMTIFEPQVPSFSR